MGRGKEIRYSQLMTRLKILLLFILYNCSLRAQPAGDSLSREFYKPDKYYFQSLLKDTKDVFLSPVHWTGNEWLGFGLSAGACALIMTQEEEIQSYITDHRTPWTENLSRYVAEPWGGVYSLSTLGGFYLVGELSGNPHGRKVALNGVKAFLISGLVARIPKVLAGRHRPYQDDPPNHWLWEGPGFKYNSFVSGHATASFAVATVIAREYPDRKWIGWLSYSIASLCSLSRIHDNKHWASDVFAGALLGYSIGRLVSADRNWKPVITPITYNRSPGIAIGYSVSW